MEKHSSEYSKEQQFNLKDLLKNPDIILAIGVKNIQEILRLAKKIDNAIDDPEFMIREFKVEDKVWIGLLFRRKDTPQSTLRSTKEVKK